MIYLIHVMILVWYIWYMSWYMYDTIDTCYDTCYDTCMIQLIHVMVCLRYLYDTCMILVRYLYDTCYDTYMLLLWYLYDTMSHFIILLLFFFSFSSLSLTFLLSASTVSWISQSSSPKTASPTPRTTAATSLSGATSTPCHVPCVTVQSSKAISIGHFTITLSGPRGTRWGLGCMRLIMGRKRGGWGMGQSTLWKLSRGLGGLNRRKGRRGWGLTHESALDFYYHSIYCRVI